MWEVWTWVGEYEAYLRLRLFWHYPFPTWPLACHAQNLIAHTKVSHRGTGSLPGTRTQSARRTRTRQRHAVCRPDRHRRDERGRQADEEGVSRSIWPPHSFRWLTGTGRYIPPGARCLHIVHAVGSPPRPGCPGTKRPCSPDPYPASSCWFEPPSPQESQRHLSDACHGEERGRPADSVQRGRASAFLRARRLATVECVDGVGGTETSMFWPAVAIIVLWIPRKVYTRTISPGRKVDHVSHLLPGCRCTHTGGGRWLACA